MKNLDPHTISKPASIEQRALALIIDSLVYVSILSVIATLFYIQETVFSGDNGSGFFIGMTLPDQTLIKIIVAWVIFMSVNEQLKRQSLGKRILKIKVVRKDLEKIGFWNSIVRHAFDLIDLFLFPILIIFKSSINKKRLGDLVANTIVIRIK